MSNVSGCTLRDYYHYIFYILQARYENPVEALKAHIELLDLYSSRYINF